MGIPQSVANKIANAKASGGGNPIKDGDYVFDVLRVICEQKFTGLCFIAEFLVVASEATEAGVEPCQVGTTCSFVANLTKHDSAAGNVKAFVLGLLGLDEASTPPDRVAAEIDRITSSANPARGMRIGCSTFRKAIRAGANAGKLITLPRWQHAAQTPAEIAANRAELGDK